MFPEHHTRRHFSPSTATPIKAYRPASRQATPVAASPRTASFTIHTLRPPRTTSEAKNPDRIRAVQAAGPQPVPSARPGKEPLVPNARGSPSRWQCATHTLDGAVRRELAISRIDNYCHLSCPLFASPHLRCSCARHSRGMEPACVVVRSSSCRTNASRWEMWTSDRRGRHKTPDIASLRDCRRWKSVRFSCCR